MSTTCLLTLLTKMNDLEEEVERLSEENQSLRESAHNDNSYYREQMEWFFETRGDVEFQKSELEYSLSETQSELTETLWSLQAKEEQIKSLENQVRLLQAALTSKLYEQEIKCLNQ